MKSRKKIKDDGKSHYRCGINSSDSDNTENVKKPTYTCRRSSKRIQNQKKSITPKSKNSDLIDSAYDADEENTPKSSPEQGCNDPYEIDMIEDVSFIKKKNTKKNASVPKKGSTSKPQNKRSKKAGSQPASGKHKPTSTPILLNTGTTKAKMQDQGTLDSFSVTPEVTPILPVKPHECVSHSDDSFVTPQIRRSARKRSLQPESFSDLSTQLSYSSQGDSGIALSPVSKKQCLNSDLKNQHSLTGEPEFSQGKKKKKATYMSKGKTITSKPTSVLIHSLMNKRNIFKPVCHTDMPQMYKAEEMTTDVPKSTEDSCFGFDSIGSPIFNIENSPPRKQKRSKNIKTVKDEYQKSSPSKGSYRSPQMYAIDSSPSSVTNELGLSGDSGNSMEIAVGPKSASPSLFSDSISDAMDLQLNRSSTRKYKPSNISRMKKTKSKEKVSKLDIWANNFNMEIEDIEKFDLNIE